MSIVYEERVYIDCGEYDYITITKMHHEANDFKYVYERWNRLLDMGYNIRESNLCRKLQFIAEDNLTEEQLLIKLQEAAELIDKPLKIRNLINSI